MSSASCTGNKLSKEIFSPVKVSRLFLVNVTLIHLSVYICWGAVLHWLVPSVPFYRPLICCYTICMCAMLTHWMGHIHTWRIWPLKQWYQYEFKLMLCSSVIVELIFRIMWLIIRQVNICLMDMLLLLLIILQLIIQQCFWFLSSSAGGLDRWQYLIIWFLWCLHVFSCLLRIISIRIFMFEDVG